MNQTTIIGPCQPSFAIATRRVLQERHTARARDLGTSVRLEIISLGTPQLVWGRL